MASTRAPLARFESASGARIYRIPVETFPGHINNLYLILDRGVPTLVDVGSGLPQSVEDLQGGFDALRTHFGERVRLEGVQHVVITHSSISSQRGELGIANLDEVAAQPNPVVLYRRPRSA